MSPSADPVVHDHSLRPEDHGLLKACAVGLGHDQIHVRPLGRFGYTGARLFEARFDGAGVGAPYVIKIDSRDQILREHAALQRASAYFHEAFASRYDSDPPTDLGCLLYRLFSKPDGSITELREVYQGTEPDDVVCSVLEDVYTACASAHTPTLRDSTLGEEYEWYLRGSRPDRILEAFPGGASAIDFMGRRTRHPSSTLAELSARTLTFNSGFVHGDLHPNNVVLDQAGRPALIDFAWAHSGDILVDYVLMECSLRLLLFPSNINWSEHCWVTEQMATVDGPDLVADKYLADSDLALRLEYTRMARAVRTIRKSAQVACGAAFSFDNYLSAQFVTLYGLSKLGVYPFLPSVDTLCAISGRLT